MGTRSKGPIWVPEYGHTVPRGKGRKPDPLPRPPRVEVLKSGKRFRNCKRK